MSLLEIPKSFLLMSKVCELTGKAVRSGNNVSHSNRKTRRRFLPNLHNNRFLSEALGKSLHFKVAASTIRTVDIYGGIDNYLLKTKCKVLSHRAVLTKRILGKMKLAKEQNVSN